jgi:hypothetical protein
MNSIHHCTSTDTTFDLPSFIHQLALLEDTFVAGFDVEPWNFFEARIREVRYVQGGAGAEKRVINFRKVKRHVIKPRSKPKSNRQTEPPRAKKNESESKNPDRIRKRLR